MLDTFHVDTACGASSCTPIALQPVLSVGLPTPSHQGMPHSIPSTYCRCQFKTFSLTPRCYVCALLVRLVCIGYAVDITIPSMRLAVEADGPSHFSRTPHPSGALLQLGATAMKRRHLQQLGWTVVNVPYSDWDKQTDEQQKVAYLKQRIAEAKRDVGAGSAAASAVVAKDTSSGST